MTDDQKATAQYQLTWMAEAGNKMHMDYDCTYADIIRLASEKLDLVKRPVGVWLRKPIATVLFETKVQKHD